MDQDEVTVGVEDGGGGEATCGRAVWWCCPWRSCARVLAASGPIPFRPLLQGCPGAAVNPLVGQPLNSWS